MPQKTKMKCHKKPKLFGGFTYFTYLCRRKRREQAAPRQFEHARLLSACTVLAPKLKH